MIEYAIEADYYYSVVPKISSNVFLMAKIVDWWGYHLLDGPVSLYYKGVYQGRTYLNLESFDDALVFSIGRDGDISQTRGDQRIHEQRLDWCQ